jgi:hypothetical protein
MNPFGKKHKYETLADLVQMSPEQIVRIDPSDIGSHILEETGGVTLSPSQRKAVFTLLAIKNQEKKSGVNLQAREQIIKKSLGNNPEVDALLVETTMKVLDEDIHQKLIENRLLKIQDQPIIPYTHEELIRIRLLKLSPEKLLESGLTLQDLERKGGQKRSRKANKKSSKKANKKTSRKGCNKRKRSSRKRC